ncbi:hypothetical protein ACIQUQ_26615 [Streptomyces sp. NPDC101118]|uniref:hypothetical protein n=1 Tax=Streptomyces sp. NPDC101118 TaxID=3366109 RepID=UPI003810C6A4
MTTTHPTHPSPSATTTKTPTPRVATLLKTTAALQTLTLFFQAATAGALLTSSTAHDLHHIGSRVMYGASMLYLLATVLAWRPGGASPRPALHATLFLALATAQVILGIAHVPSLHVPLGTLLFALSALTLSNRLRPARRA